LKILKKMLIFSGFLVEQFCENFYVNFDFRWFFGQYRFFWWI
jgi:hypothetical protein